MKNSFLCLAVLVLGLGLGSAERTDAAVVMEIEQAGPDLRVSYSGSLDLTGLSFRRSDSNIGAFLFPAGSTLGNQAGTFDLYGPFGDVPAFGTGPLLATLDAFGDPVSFIGTANSPLPYLTVPAGYSSGAPLSGGFTFAGESFETAGLTPGTSVFDTLPSGDTITVSVAPIPVPPSLAMLLSAFGLCIALRRRA